MIRRLLRRKTVIRQPASLAGVDGGEATIANLTPAAHGNSRQGGPLQRNARPVWTLAAPLQTRLAVGPVDDPLEREADAIADQVTASPNGVTWMRAPAGIAPPRQFTPASIGRRSATVQRDAPAARAATEEERREFEAMRREFEARRAEFFGMVGEQMSEDILGRAGFAAGAGGSRQRPTTPDEALQVTTMWGVTRDVLVAALPNLGLSLQGSVRGAHGSDTLAARQQALIDAMTPDGQRAYREAIAALRREPFWANYLDTTTVFIFPDLSGANRYAGYTQRGTERDPDGNETRAFIIHISKDALEAGNLDSVVANLVHELSHTLDVGATIRPALDSFLDELAGLLADHPDVQALRQGAADAAEARTTHVRRISQILYEHTGYGEAEVFAHLQQLTHQPAVDVSGQQVSGSRYILGTIEGYIRQLMSIGINPRTLDNLLDALGRRAAILYDRRIEAAPAGSTQRQRLQREKEIAQLTLRLARDLAREEPVQPKREQGAQAGEERELEHMPATGLAAGGPAPSPVHSVLRSSGQPLDPATRAWVEPRFGRAFGDVRVHTDPGAARSAEAIRARAYTSGRHIAFAAGQYAPHTPAGLRLLAHELSHVVQQDHAPAAQQPIARWPWDEPVTLNKVLPAQTVLRNSQRVLFTQLNGYPMKDMLAAFAAMEAGGALDGMIANFDLAEGVNRPRLKVAMDAAKLRGRGTPPTDSELSELKSRMAGMELPSDQQAEVLSFLGVSSAPKAPPASTPAAVAPTNFKTSSYALSTAPVIVVKADEKKGLKELREAPADYAARILEMAGLDNATWFSSFTSITFLGQSVSDIHTDLATHLKAVETKFAESHGGPSKDPAVAGAALGLNQAIGGGRHAPTGTAFSMHLFGLAIDVNYKSNPWVGSSANKVFERAGWLAAGKKLHYKDGMTYDDLKALDEALETYFSYIDNAAALSAQLAAIADDANPWKGKLAEDAVKLIDKDLDAVVAQWQRAGSRDVIKQGGFLSLPKDLVNGIGLDWGASYGDIMHFDMRNKGNGRKIQSAIGAYKKKKLEEAKAE